MKVVDAHGETCMFITIYLGVSCPNFIISSFNFQVKIYLHINCPHVDLVDLVLAYMFIRCYRSIMQHDVVDYNVMKS
jgi:hypothetical protein